MALRRKKEAPPVDTGPRRLVVVNDDVNACELLVRILGIAGYEVGRAHDFLELSDLVVAMKPHCVVLDVASGGIGGNLKLLDAIRNHPDEEVAGTRVVLIAGSASSAVFSWQAGIDEFLHRPFHADELLAAVTTVLERPEDERRRHRRQRADAAQASSPRSL